MYQKIYCHHRNTYAWKKTTYFTVIYKKLKIKIKKYYHYNDLSYSKLMMISKLDNHHTKGHLKKSILN